MKLGEVIVSGGGLLAAVMTLLQIAPVKIAPWSWLAQAIAYVIDE